MLNTKQHGFVCTHYDYRGLSSIKRTRQLGLLCTKVPTVAGRIGTLLETMHHGGFAHELGQTT